MTLLKMNDGHTGYFVHNKRCLVLSARTSVSQMKWRKHIGETGATSHTFWLSHHLYLGNGRQ